MPLLLWIPYSMRKGHHPRRGKVGQRPLLLDMRVALLPLILCSSRDRNGSQHLKLAVIACSLVNTLFIHVRKQWSRVFVILSLTFTYYSSVLSN